MEPKYQIIFLGNTPFEIIGSEAKLREFGKPDHQIKLEELPVADQGYDFVYNRKTNAVVEMPQPIQEGFERIILHLEIAQLQEQCPHEDILQYNEQSKEEDWGTYMADDYMRGYLAGKPVEFDLEGTTFTLDVNRKLLWENDNPDNTIRLNELPSSPMGYELQYDPAIKNVIYPGQPERKIPVTFFDQMVNYDPLGMALKYDISIGRLPGWDNDLNYESVLKKCRQFNGPVEQQYSAAKKRENNKTKIEKPVTKGNKIRR